MSSTNNPRDDNDGTGSNNGDHIEGNQEPETPIAESGAVSEQQARESQSRLGEDETPIESNRFAAQNPPQRCDTAGGTQSNNGGGAGGDEAAN
jgi:hypothetical protein